MFEASCSSKDPQNPRTDEPTLTVDDYIDLDNTMVEYASMTCSMTFFTSPTIDISILKSM
jgi:hypothetical protein